MRKWFEVKAINRCGNIEHSDFASYGSDCWDYLDEHLQAVIKSVREQNPGCEIVVEKG